MNGKADPLTFDVTGKEVHEVKGYYHSDDIRDDLTDRGIEPVIDEGSQGLHPSPPSPEDSGTRTSAVCLLPGSLI